MTKAKKEVDLKHFTIQKVENGWAIEARAIKSFFDWSGKSDAQTKQYVFNDMIDMTDWIEANV